MTTWSAQQEAIFSWFKTGSGNLVVRARAGTGKTTTILSAIGHAPESEILLCAFNKKIAEELKTKLRNPNAEAKTLHSVGFSLVLRNWTGTRLDGQRGLNLARQVVGLATPDPIVNLVNRLAAKGKAILPKTVQEMADIAVQFDLTPDEEWESSGWTTETVAKGALDAMRLAATQRDGTIDFDDMIFVPVYNNWLRRAYSMVVVDEAQDMNASQLALATGICRKDGRIVVVGDDRQAIYGFRGADSGSLDRLKTNLKATELGLTTTYRCPQVVVDYAKTLVPDYQAAPTAPVGLIETIDYAKLAGMVNGGDFVLSRKNAPLVKTCLSFLRLGKRAKVEGRDLGATLIGIIKKLKGRTVKELLAKLNKWSEKAIVLARLLKSEEAQDAKIAEIEDTVATLQVLAEGLTSVAELQTRVQDMFADDVGGSFIVCSSIHRSKGRETDNVFVLRDTLYPGKNKSKGQEETNIEYVAVTRTRAKLTWVMGGTK